MNFKSAIASAALLLAVIFIGWQSIHYAKFSMQFGGFDLRNRVVAARQTAAGLDPYRFKWKPGMPERLFDPQDDHSRQVTRMTSPPTRLLIDLPFFERLSYLSIRKGVLILNVALITILSTLSLFYLPSLISKILFAFCLVSFSTSRGWLMNLERGQQYLELAALTWLGLLLTFLDRAPRLGNTLWGTFLALRPTGILIQTFAVLSRTNRREVRFTAGVATLWIAISLVAFGPTLWKGYFWQAKEWGSGKFSPREFDPATPYPPQPEFIDHPDAPKRVNRLYEGPTFAEPQLNLMRLSFMPAEWVWSYWPIQAIAFALMALFFGVAWRFSKVATDPTSLLYARGYAFLIVSEYLLPIPRNLYVLPFILPMAFSVFWLRKKWRWGLLPLGFVMAGFWIIANFTFDWHTPSHHQGWADAAFFLAALLMTILPAAEAHSETRTL